MSRIGKPISAQFTPTNSDLSLRKLQKIITQLIQEHKPHAATKALKEFESERIKQSHTLNSWHSWATTAIQQLSRN